MPTPLFQKGAKPGPGRPKGSMSHIEWCDEFADGEGKERLIAWARSKSGKVSMQALTLIFAYGKGKPKETAEINGNMSFNIVESYLKNRADRNLE